MFNLQRFCIQNLHGTRTIDVHIKDNRLVLVGENGTGKTIFAKFLYYALSNQWEKMLEHQFDNLIIQIDDEEFHISRIAIDFHVTEILNQRKPILDIEDSVIYIAKQFGYTPHKLQQQAVFEEAIIKIALYTPIPPVQVEMRLKEYLEKISALAHGIFYETLTSFIDLTATLEVEILFLPTYRLIEKDLNHLPIKQGFALVALSDELRGSYANSDDTKVNHIEFINFDMSDVKAKLHYKLGELKYLLENQTKGLTLASNPKDIQQAILAFVEVCNFYLQSNKEMVYDRSKFEIFIRQKGRETRIDFKMLSSGEKQIVSLFSQLYLSGKDSYFIIIDEPELSLSFIWQRRFLPDILNSGKCRGLVATTQSPFIFENELEDFTYAIEDFVREL